MNGMHGSVVLLSGGQDSTTCLYYALSMPRLRPVLAVTIDYYQRHRIELRAAAKIAKQAGVEHLELPLNLEHLKQNALVNTGVAIEEKPGGLPTTFVPGRNVLALTLAAGIAYERKLGSLVIGVSQADYSGYPDCRAVTLQSISRTLRLALERPVRIVAPLLHATKADTVRLARSLGTGCWAAMAYTHTCYAGKATPCGECPACKLRAKGFKEAGYKDPLIERLQPAKRDA